jgi:hypothetical protein
MADAVAVLSASVLTYPPRNCNPAVICPENSHIISTACGIIADPRYRFDLEPLAVFDERGGTLENGRLSCAESQHTTKELEGNDRFIVFHILYFQLFMVIIWILFM